MNHWPLPTEITIEILQLLTYHELWNLSRASQFVYRVAKSRFLFGAVRVGSADFITSERSEKAATTLLNPIGEQKDTNIIRGRWRTELEDDRNRSKRKPFRRGLQGDVAFIRKANIGSLITEAFMGVTANQQDGQALHDLLSLTPNLRSAHIFGGNDANGALYASAAMRDLRMLCRSLETLEFVWFWCQWGRFGNTLLDVSSDGPRNLRKLKMDLLVKVCFSKNIPQGMLPRIIRRASVDSLNTLTVLDIKYSLSYGQWADFSSLAGAPLRVLRHDTWRTLDDKGFLTEYQRICELFPDLEELELKERGSAPYWTDDFLSILSNLSKCKTLTVPFRIHLAQISDFANIDGYDAFINSLPDPESPEYGARFLLLRIAPTKAIVDAMPALEKLTWATDLDGVDHVVNIVRLTLGICKIVWERRSWWDSVSAGRLGPDHLGLNYRDLWAAFVTENMSRTDSN